MDVLLCEDEMLIDEGSSVHPQGGDAPSFKDKLLGDKGGLREAKYISELDVEVGADDVRLGGNSTLPEIQFSDRLGGIKLRDDVRRQEGTSDVEVVHTKAAPVPQQVNPGSPRHQKSGDRVEWVSRLVIEPRQVSQSTKGELRTIKGKGLEAPTLVAA
ncbi:hypothetical protein V6N13_043198 [Hibiscus sabdariffa]